MEERPTFPLIHQRQCPLLKRQTLTFLPHLKQCSVAILSENPSSKCWDLRCLIEKDTIIHVNIITHWFSLNLKYQLCIHHNLCSSYCCSPSFLLCGDKGGWAVWSDGTAEVVNNLLRHRALSRVTNVYQRNRPREVRAGLLTPAPLSAAAPWLTQTAVAGVCFCVHPPLLKHTNAQTFKNEFTIAVMSVNRHIQLIIASRFNKSCNLVECHVKWGFQIHEPVCSLSWNDGLESSSYYKHLSREK